MIGESWCTAALVAADGRLIRPPERVHNSWLLPGRRVAANLAYGAAQGGYQPFVYLAIGSSATPVPSDRNQSGLQDQIGIRKKATSISPATASNIITLAVDFFGDEFTGNVREVALYNAAVGGHAVYRYVYPSALPLASNVRLPIIIEIDILNIP